MATLEGTSETAEPQAPPPAPPETGGDTATTAASDGELGEVDGLDTVLANTAETFDPEPIEDGTVIAEQSGTEITAEGRQEQTFGSEAAAVAHARSLDGPAAVLQEGNRYAVYEAEHQGSWFNPFGEEISLEDAANSGTRDDVNDTDLTARVDNLAAIVTNDDYVMRFEPGAGNPAVIDRVGSPLGPLDGALQAYGPGLENLTDADAVEDAFELAMRDTAYAALDAAEVEALTLQAELDGSGLSPSGRAALDTALTNLDEIDAQIEGLREDARDAFSQAYNDLPLITKAFAPEAALQIANAAGEPFYQEIAALEAQRSQAAAGFPLALRIEDREAFRDLSRTEQDAALSEEIDGVLEDVGQTRSNLDNDDLDLWGLPGLISTTAQQLGLEGEQLEIVNDKADWESTKDILYNVGEGVLAVGLAVGGFFTGGATWAGLGLLGASAAVSLHGAVRVTDDYQDLNAAANTALDPAQGLAPPDAAPHWGWVAAAWVGVGLDAAAVVKPAITALRGVGSVAEAIDAGQPIARETAEAALRQAAADANLPASQVDDFVRRALPALTGEGGPPPAFREIGDSLFSSRFGTPDAEAVTTIREVDGAFQVEIVTRAGADPTAAVIAKNEELGHLLQVSDPAWSSQVGQLTEEALGDWGTRSLSGRASAYRAQHELEIDLLQQRIGDLTETAASGPGAARAQALDELPALEERLAGMTNALDDLNGPTPPSWLADAPPPRLFNRPAASATQAAHREVLGIQAADVPDGFLLRQRQNGSYEVYRNPRDSHWETVRQEGGNPETMGARLVEDGDGFRIETRTISPDEVRLTAAQQRAAYTRDFGEPLADFDTFETALRGTSPYQSAYSRSYAGVFRQLEDAGVPPSQVLDRLRNTSEAGFDHALRSELREAIIDTVMARPADDRLEALTGFFRSAPEGFQGSLFSEFRQRNLGGDLRLVDTVPGDTRLAGTQRFGDGLVDVRQAAEGGANGPQRTGTYLVEDKSSGTAFTPSQFDRYNDALAGGTLRTANGETQGVTYFFPDEDAAARALSHIRSLERQGEAVSPNIHIGFYDEAGLLEWAR